MNIAAYIVNEMKRPFAGHKPVAGKDNHRLFPDKIHFIFINYLVFINPFIRDFGAYAVQDIWMMSLIFSAFICIELLIMAVSLKLNKYYLDLFLQTGFTVFNIINFTFFLTREIHFQGFFFLIAASLILFFFIKQKSVRTTLFFSIAFISISIINKLVIPFLIGNNSSSIGLIDHTLKAKRSIFIIGIDGMISSSIYKKYYKSESNATRKLDDLGYALMDIISPGSETLETYSALVSYEKDKAMPWKLFRQNFANPSSPFYKDLRSVGYKKQFFFKNEYFGLDQSNVYDDFYPKKSSFFNFCSFVDPRWGCRTCSLYNNFQKKNYRGKMPLAELISFYENGISKIFDDSNYWFSISHIWFPGHAFNYDPKNQEDFKRYTDYYVHSQEDLSVLFTSIHDYIISKDSNAIIVFFGDHGSWLLKGAKEGDFIQGFGKVTNSDLMLDLRSSLLAIYPESFGKSVINDLGDHTELLFRKILEKAGR
jgi:hypothetical protein